MPNCLFKNFSQFHRKITSKVEAGEYNHLGTMFVLFRSFISIKLLDVPQKTTMEHKETQRICTTFVPTSQCVSYPIVTLRKKQLKISSKLFFEIGGTSLSKYKY